MFKRFAFLFVIFALFPSALALSSAQSGGTLDLVPTFHSLGLTWTGEQPQHVDYRPVDQQTWAEAYPLAALDGQYRGSIVHLTPCTPYEIRLRLAGEVTVSDTVMTWCDGYPIANTTDLPTTTSTYSIREGGSAQSGYVIYENGQINVGNNRGTALYIYADYVVVRYTTIIGGSDYGIYIANNVSHVIIEHNDISGFADDGVFVSPGVDHVILQRNVIHDPSRGVSVSGSSAGATASYFQRAGGNHVVRYNTVFSDKNHQFGDCFGGSENFSENGFPNHDSDIYGNYLSNCADNAIETEGGNRNVRVWGNYITDSYNAVSSRDTRLGPLYFWRNVSGNPLAGYSGGPLVRFGKNGGEDSYQNSQGEFYFHNTLWTPRYEQALEGNMGNTTTRNNILDVNNARVINNYSGLRANDFDYDLMVGTIRSGYGSTNNREPHQIVGRPVYVDGAGIHQDGARYWGTFTLDASSPGYNAGVVIPNFNTGCTMGSAPDMGAHESGQPPMEFGTLAYLTGEPCGDSFETGQPQPTVTPTPADTPVPITPSHTPIYTSTPVVLPTITPTPEQGRVWQFMSRECTESADRSELVCVERYSAK